MTDRFTSARCRQQAEEARSLAAAMKGDESRDAMLAIARSYDKLSQYLDKPSNPRPTEAESESD